MSKDKYPSIFSPQMEAIVFIILQIFFGTRAVLKIGEYSRIFPSLSWGIRSRDKFRPIAREQKDLMDYCQRASREKTLNECVYQYQKKLPEGTGKQKPVINDIDK